jgi:hypothetical protein
LFEDFNDHFVILGQKPGCEPLLFSFPISDSTLWAKQGLGSDPAAARIHSRIPT